MFADKFSLIHSCALFATTTVLTFRVWTLLVLTFNQKQQLRFIVLLSQRLSPLCQEARLVQYQQEGSCFLHLCKGVLNIT